MMSLLLLFIYNLLMRITMYQIEHFTLCDGWINTSTDDNGEPVLFDTLEQAQEALESHWSDLQAEGMANTYSRDEWRVAEIYSSLCRCGKPDNLCDC
jgi:hypothetical protein